MPDLNTGNYFTASMGGGTQLADGAQVTESQTVYVFAATGTDNLCWDEDTFDIVINTTPDVGTFDDVEECDSYTLPDLTTGNYFTASMGGGTQLADGAQVTESQTVYVFAATGTDNLCWDEDTFDIVINTTPDVGTFDDVEECDSYTLPDLTTGNYFTASMGGGTQLADGAQVTESQTVYVFAATGTDNLCWDEDTFDIVINTTPDVGTFDDVEECDSYTLPDLTTGNYFTASMGGGTQLADGAQVTESQTVYVFAATGTDNLCWDEDTFDIVINTTPDVGTFDDVEECDSYTLPDLTTGNYFTASMGGGTQLADGAQVTESQTVYVFAATGTDNLCWDEDTFDIVINTTPDVGTFDDVEECDSYTLPDLTTGNYFTASMGGGTQLADGAQVTESQTVYVFAATGTDNLCWDEDTFDIVINTTPDVGTFDDVEECDSYTLPDLTTGNYFTASMGGGTQLADGAQVTESQTVYVFAATGTDNLCWDEDTFDIVINTTPDVGTF